MTTRRFNHAVWAVLVVLLPIATVVATESPPPPSPPALEGETLQALGRLGTLALRPVTVAGAVGQRPDVAAEFAARIQRHLEGAGFTVIPATAYGTLYDQLNRDLGGIYDPITGRLKEEQAKALLEHAEREHKRLHPHDAVVFARVAGVLARFNGGKAAWHGVEEPTWDAPKGKLAKFLAGEPASYGTLPALSLAVGIEGPDRKAIYAGVGGIQLLEKLENNLRSAPVPQDQLLRDPAVLDRAADIAFRRLDASAQALRDLRSAGSSSPSDPVATTSPQAQPAGAP